MTDIYSIAKERMFNTARKLGGVFGIRSEEDRRPLLYNLIRRMRGVEKLRESEGWPVLMEILNDYRAGVSDELGRKLLSDQELHRLNHRMELVKQITEEFDRVLREGQAALVELNKIAEKEKRNAG